MSLYTDRLPSETRLCNRRTSVHSAITQRYMGGLTKCTETPLGVCCGLLDRCGTSVGGNVRARLLVQLVQGKERERSP